ncbi:hypothetical protein [Nocardiopsis salina]|uniref:hypothetical protein n=1 Tax=Nocardiopsis salina TaxID=245836 RepID=UPI00035DCB91|nr:hypothetical protein [Nocardiopsis salina]
MFVQVQQVDAVHLLVADAGLEEQLVRVGGEAVAGADLPGVLADAVEVLEGA